MRKKFWDEDGWTQRAAYRNRRMRANRQGFKSYWPEDCRPGAAPIANLRFDRMMRSVR